MKCKGVSVGSGGNVGEFDSFDFSGKCSECPDGEKPLEVFITTDAYPEETIWKIINVYDGYTISKGGLYREAESTYETPMNCIPSDKKYKFTIEDEWGDGFCCYYGEGSYEIKFDGNVVASSSDFTGSYQSTSWGSC